MSGLTLNSGNWECSNTKINSVSVHNFISKNLVCVARKVIAILATRKYYEDDWNTSWGASGHDSRPFHAVSSTLRVSWTKNQHTHHAHIFRCMCCACTCQNCVLSECCGCKWSGTTCCLEGSAVCCKYIDHPTACCLCWSGSYECVKPKQLCKLYEQCFCWECFFSVSSLKDGYRKTPIAQTAVQDEFLPKAQSKPIIFWYGTAFYAFLFS